MAAVSLIKLPPGNAYTLCATFLARPCILHNICAGLVSLCDSLVSEEMVIEGL